MASKDLTVCVYCGSATGARPEFAEAARELGTRLAERGDRVVYGGGRVGLMGIVADATLDAGGEVIGVLPERLATVELQHSGCTELHIVPDMHARKALMADYADVFVALPGGIGTLEELFEMATWKQLGYHAKPVYAIDTDGFYAPLIEMLGVIERDGFLRPSGGEPPTPISFVATVEEFLATLPELRERPS